jgi:hypothetical protein
MSSTRKNFQFYEKDSPPNNLPNHHKSTQTDPQFSELHFQPNFRHNKQEFYHQENPPHQPFDVFSHPHLNVNPPINQEIIASEQQKQSLNMRKIPNDITTNSQNRNKENFSQRPIQKCLIQKQHHMFQQQMLCGQTLNVFPHPHREVNRFKKKADYPLLNKLKQTLKS